MTNWSRRSNLKLIPYKFILQVPVVSFSIFSARIERESLLQQTSIIQILLEVSQSDKGNQCEVVFCNLHSNIYALLGRKIAGKRVS